MSVVRIRSNDSTFECTTGWINPPEFCASIVIGYVKQLHSDNYGLKDHFNLGDRIAIYQQLYHKAIQSWINEAEEYTDGGEYLIMMNDRVLNSYQVDEDQPISTFDMAMVLTNYTDIGRDRHRVADFVNNNTGNEVTSFLWIQSVEEYDDPEDY